MRKCRDAEIRQILGFVSAVATRFPTTASGPTSVSLIPGQLQSVGITAAFAMSGFGQMALPHSGNLQICAAEGRPNPCDNRKLVPPTKTKYFFL
jgi:hypothetical protein